MEWLLIIIVILMVILLLFNCETYEHMSPGTGIQIQSKQDVDWGLINGQTMKYVRPWYDGLFNSPYNQNGEFDVYNDRYNPWENINYQ